MSDYRNKFTEAVDEATTIKLSTAVSTNTSAAGGREDCDVAVESAAAVDVWDEDNRSNEMTSPLASPIGPNVRNEQRERITQQIQTLPVTQTPFENSILIF